MKLSKYIYYQTKAENILMTRENGSFRKLKWSEQNQCYYDIEDNMII